MSKQNLIADSIFAFLSPCLLFIMSKSAVDCRTFQSSHYSNQNRTVIGGDSVQNGSFRVVLPIVTHLQCVLSTLQYENVRKSPNLRPDFAILWKLGNLVGCTGRWNFNIGDKRTQESKKSKILHNSKSFITFGSCKLQMAKCYAETDPHYDRP